MKLILSTMRTAQTPSDTTVYGANPPFPILVVCDPPAFGKARLEISSRVFLRVVRALPLRMFHVHADNFVPTVPLNDGMCDRYSRQAVTPAHGHPASSTLSVRADCSSERYIPGATPGVNVRTAWSSCPCRYELYISGQDGVISSSSVLWRLHYYCLFMGIICIIPILP